MRLGAIAGAILLAQRNRVLAQLARQVVHRAFHREGRDRRTRRTIRRHLRPVADHVVADDIDVRDVVHCQPAHAARPDRRTGERARLVLQHLLRRDDAAVLFGTQLHFDRGAGRRTGSAEYFIPRHLHLHRATGLLGQRDRHRFQIHQRLAAEAAADLQRHRADVGEVDAQQLRTISPDHEMALAGAVDHHLTVGIVAAQAGMRLDIGLVHGLGGVAAFHNHVGILEAGVHVALLERHHLGDVGRLGRLRFDAGREQIVVQDGGVVGHRVLDVDDVGQHFVLHVDQRDRGVGDRLRRGGDGGYRVAFVQRFVPRQAVARQVAEVHRTFADECFLIGDVGKILRRHHGLHTRQLFRLAGVDRQDLRMGVRRAQHLAPQHAGHAHVGAELGGAGHLLHAVRTHRTTANDLQVRSYVIHAAFSPRITAAASMTARITLS